jgi:hypothetical protein
MFGTSELPGSASRQPCILPGDGFAQLQAVLTGDGGPALAPRPPPPGAAVTGAAAAEWSTQRSRTTGEMYFVNSITGESQFEAPPGLAAPAAPAAPAAHSGLPPNWMTQVSRSTGETYYVNTLTGESTFDLPTTELPAGWETQVRVAYLPVCDSARPFVCLQHPVKIQDTSYTGLAVDGRDVLRQQYHRGVAVRVP